MKTVAMMALALAVAGVAVVPGCDKSRDEMRPDKDAIMNERGLQSHELIEMTDQMAPQLLAIPEIVQSPTKITIVVKGVINKLEGEQTRDIDIYVARLAGLLNSHASRDRVAFIEERATGDRMAAQELGNPDPFEQGSRNPIGPSQAIVPQYALYGEFHSMNNGKTTYYLCQFKLMNFATRQLVWEGQYDTRTLNH